MLETAAPFVISMLSIILALVCIYALKRLVFRGAGGLAGK